MQKIWFIRAGRGAGMIGEFTEKGVVALSFDDIRIGDLSSFSERSELVEEIIKHVPNYKRSRAVMAASQLFRFAKEISEGDFVLSYDSSTRTYHLGTIKSPYRYAEGEIERYPHLRKVSWDKQFERDMLSVSTKNRLGSIATLFLVGDEARDEVLAAAEGRANAPHPESEVEEGDEGLLLEDIQSRSREFIKDRLNRLDWQEMQEVVAGLLRAMGYKTRVSPAGPDRGRDIIASPDGFGFEQPRIVVEVKHRQSSMGAQEIRSFLGGRHKDDKGLYVSTGGFTKDAFYEAERANIPLTLMDLDGLVEGLIEYYEKLDVETRGLVPLVRVYWVG